MADTQKKRAPVNTQREAMEVPILPIARAMMVGASESIYQQEAEGQQSFVNSETLPAEIGRYSDYDERAILEAAGVKFLGEVEGDSMFQYVELPEGWKKVPTDHSMWSKLVDNKGRERAAIFYKAAFYDRSAHMSLTRRFDVSNDYKRQESEGVAVAVVTDGGQVVHTTDAVAIPDRDDFQAKEQVCSQVVKAAIEWLEHQYPDWRKPGAYWD